MSILNQSLENIKLLSDQQLSQVLQAARSGNGQLLQALGMQSAVPLLAEKARRDNIRQSQAGQQAMQQGQQPTIADQIMGQGQEQASVSGIGTHEIPGMMEEQNFADGGIVAFAGGGQPQTLEELRQRTMMAESGGDPDAIGPETRYGRAKGDMQVLDMTNRDPGFGVTPAQGNSKEERSRVGDDYLDAMVKKYNSYPYASLAYNWGPGNVDNWIKRGANPAEIPKKSLAYVEQTTGKNLADMSPGAVANLSKSAPQGIASVAPKEPDFASRARELDGIRQTRLADVEKAYEEAIAALGPAPTARDLEAIRKKALNEAAAINAPYLEEMRALTQSSEPSGKDAINKGLLALMTGRGRGLSGAIGDMAAAGGIGLDAYTAAQSKHQEAQRLMLKSKFELAKGDKQYADQLADAAVREDKTAAGLYKAGLQNAQQSRRSDKMAVDQSMDARLATEREIARGEQFNTREANRTAAADRDRSNRDSAEALRAATARFNQMQRDISAVDKRVNGKDFDTFSYSKDPTYVKIKTEQGSGAADAWARKQAREAELEEVFRIHGSSRREYAELGRLISTTAGIAGLPATPSAPSTPSPAAPARGDYVYNPKTGKSEQIK